MCEINYKSVVPLILLSVWTASIAMASYLQEEKADAIYHGGIILTIDDENTVAQAIAVKDGKILNVGHNDAVLKFRGENTQVVDLKGKTLLPGFIDGHSHFMGFGRSSTVDISPPPVGTVKNIADIVKLIKAYQKEQEIKPGEWIFARGYDPDELEERRHPNKEDLDHAFPANPVLLTHTSGHMSVVNSYALKRSGVHADTPDPDGGKIVKEKGTNEPTGLLLERARSVLNIERKQLSLEEQLLQLEEQQQWYASHGITTAQDGSSAWASIQLLREAARRQLLYIDIAALPSFATVERLLEEENHPFDTLTNHLKLKGTKLFTDGSPQGKTAFFSEPYLTDVPGCDHDCTGIPTISQDELNEQVLKAFENNIQTYVHCNGDAAVAMYIKAVRYANDALNDTISDRRPVIIHSQFVRADQLDAYSKLGMIPSFFTNHAFFWGDTHLRNLGEKRAFFLSPTQSAKQRNIIFTNHTDFGVTPINQLFLLWTSVARESRTGKVIGPEERLTPLEALRAITINGAYQYKEEARKGSLEKGKLADFAILSENPIEVPVRSIKDIIVLETIKEGKTIFKR